MLAVAVKFGLSTWGFVSKHWKVFVAIGILIAGYFYHQNAVVEYGNARFNEGSKATLVKVREQIALNNEANRLKEIELDNALADYSDKQKKLEKDRIAAEDKISQKIETLIQSDPRMATDQTSLLRCSISNELLEERNKIRSLMTP